MHNIILSVIEIPALIDLIADEVVTQLLNRQPSIQIPTPPTPPTPTSSEPVRLFGDKAAAKYLGCSVMTVQNLRKSGRISFYRTGRKVYYVTTELDSALQFTPRKFGK